MAFMLGALTKPSALRLIAKGAEKFDVLSHLPVSDSLKASAAVILSKVSGSAFTRGLVSELTRESRFLAELMQALAEHVVSCARLQVGGPDAALGRALHAATALQDETEAFVAQLGLSSEGKPGAESPLSGFNDDKLDELIRAAQFLARKTQAVISLMSLGMQALAATASARSSVSLANLMGASMLLERGRAVASASAALPPLLGALLAGGALTAAELTKLLPKGATKGGASPVSFLINELCSSSPSFAVLAQVSGAELYALKLAPNATQRSKRGVSPYTYQQAWLEATVVLIHHTTGVKPSSGPVSSYSLLLLRDDEASEPGEAVAAVLPLTTLQDTNVLSYGAALQIKDASVEDFVPFLVMEAVDACAAGGRAKAAMALGAAALPAPAPGAPQSFVLGLRPAGADGGNGDEDDDGSDSDGGAGGASASSSSSSAAAGSPSWATAKAASPHLWHHALRLAALDLSCGGPGALTPQAIVAGAEEDADATAAAVDTLATRVNDGLLLQAFATGGGAGGAGARQVALVASAAQLRSAAAAASAAPLASSSGGGAAGGVKSPAK